MNNSTTKKVSLHGFNYKLITVKTKSGYATNVFKEGEFKSRHEELSSLKRDSIAYTIVMIENNDYSKFTR